MSDPAGRPTFDLPLVLASASPRRRELLCSAGLSFEVSPADVPEDLAGFRDPAGAALELARRKALSCARLRTQPALVLGADTVVARFDGSKAELLGKPRDAHQARRMLISLAGSRHQVVTGVCAVRCPDLESAQGFERTWVTFRALSPAELEDYVESGEWRDKAGAYAIQERADRFVTGLEGGGFDNVVGLPLGLALRLLAQAQGAARRG